MSLTDHRFRCRICGPAPGGLGAPSHRWGHQLLLPSCSGRSRWTGSTVVYKNSGVPALIFTHYGTSGSVIVVSITSLSFNGVLSIADLTPPDPRKSGPRLPNLGPRSQDRPRSPEGVSKNWSPDRQAELGEHLGDPPASRAKPFTYTSHPQSTAEVCVCVCVCVCVSKQVESIGCSILLRG